MPGDQRGLMWGQASAWQSEPATPEGKKNENVGMNLAWKTGPFQSFHDPQISLVTHLE